METQNMNSPKLVTCPGKFAPSGRWPHVGGGIDPYSLLEEIRLMMDTQGLSFRQALSVFKLATEQDLLNHTVADMDAGDVRAKFLFDALSETNSHLYEVTIGLEGLLKQIQYDSKKEDDKGDLRK